MDPNPSAPLVTHSQNRHTAPASGTRLLSPRAAAGGILAALGPLIHLLAWGLV
jgi:hypothetical protein